jgi:rRNA maturation RNase YbeY
MEISVLIDKGVKGCPDPSWLQGIAREVLVAEGVSAVVELGLFIATQKKVQQLNRDYLGRDELTDVLAFSAREEAETELPLFVQPPDGVLHLGEVIISYPQAVIQAKEHRHSIKKELAILIIHGVLHLLGYEHDKLELERQMKAREKEILSYIEEGLELRVLGIAGSPRRGGNTDILLAEVMKGAASKGAETKTIVLNKLKITPCQHCDACLETGRCKVKDDMQMIYDELEWADRIVLASPVHFMGVTAQAKAMIDRCQALWVRKYILKKPPLGNKRERKGLFISVGGLKIANLFEPALATVKSLFKVLDIAYAGELLFPGIDGKGAITQNPEALKRAFLAGQRLVAD